MPIYWTGFCDDSGNFSLDKRGQFREWVKKFAGFEVVVSVEKKKVSRSLEQNAYWWAVPVQILAEELGYTPSQMHYALLGECFGYREGPAGHAIPNVPSSSDLTVDEFKKLIDWVLVWAPSELHIDVPPPNEARVA